MLPVSLLFSVVSISVSAPPQQPAESREGPSEAVALDADAESWAEEVLRSCATALGDGRCLLRSPDDADWQAEVAFEAAGVQVTLSRSGHTVVRRLEFVTADSVQQRRVAAGLLVAAMTAAVELENPSPSPSEPEEEAPAPLEPVVEESTAEDEAPRRTTTLQAAVQLGQTLGGSHVGGGGLIGLTWWLSQSSGLALGARSAYSSHDSFDVLNLQGEIGPTFSLLSPSSTWDWLLSSQLVIDVIRVEDRGVGSLSAERAGLRLQTSVGWRRPISPFVGIAATALSPALEVQRDGVEVLSVPPALVSGFLGLRWSR